MKSLIALCLVMTMIELANSLSSVKVKSPRKNPLGQRSTALDVLGFLNTTRKLASFINLQDNNEIPPRQSVAVVTGGSSGIGIPTIEALSLARMKVILCARNLDAAESAIQSLPPSLQANVSVQKLDLSDMASVELAAQEIVNDLEGSQIDVILNNAGVMAPPTRELTAQGLELQFGTNHVGHHMFTRLLLPYLNQDEGRVVTVASTAHSFGQLDFQNLNFDRGYSAWGAYGQSKLANILFAKGLDDELKKAGNTGKIKSVSLHPGVISTNLWRYTPKWTRPFLNFLVADRSIDQGAASNIYCSLVEGEEFRGGEYVTDCEIKEPQQNGRDELGTLRTKLWDATENIIKENGYVLPETLLGSRESSKALS